MDSTFKMIVHQVGFPPKAVVMTVFPVTMKMYHLRSYKHTQRTTVILVK